MKLERVRASKNDLPRRLMNAAPQTSSNIIDTPPKQSTSKKRNELKESKKILFSKYMVDHRKQMTNSMNRGKFEMSDDAISSYPNSSYSTVRDITGSSISSAMASGSHAYDESQQVSPVKEKNLLYPPEDYLVTSDSFEYENHDDRYRITEMSSKWMGGRPQGPANQIYHNRSISQQREVDLQNLNRYPLNLNASSYPVYQSLNENIENVTDSNTPVFRPQKHLYSLYEQQTSSSNSSTLLSNRSGYTREHLLRAKKFGAVVGALRKPGHHVGPAKNPDCMCEHCKRWVIEREQIRGRAFSVGDEPLITSKFWLKRNLV